MILGATQYGVLKALVTQKLWYGGGIGCGWNWGSQTNTERVLEALVKKGLVSKEEESVGGNIGARTTMIYRATKLGLEHVETIRAAEAAKHERWANKYGGA